MKNKLAITLEDLNALMDDIAKEAPVDSLGLSKMGMDHMSTMLAIRAFKKAFYVGDCETVENFMKENGIGESA